MPENERDAVSSLTETTLDTYAQLFTLACNVLKLPFTLPGDAEHSGTEDGGPAGSHLTGPEVAPEFNARGREALARYQDGHQGSCDIPTFNDIDPDCDAPANFGV
ncbi:hypothetical protein [Parvularcula lutaonensis]|uniref:Uncharacterized protein n=1 Tax=Parvularcula lutaonensis TaxID=491923 RepID=A0ABV7M9X7_9PROT|nr:hypothetical protein [Parvularcula lutaonensis]GGY43524.1 hypothetical protein GCM10007148_10380 [Parvularcula lutaonensis]